MILSVHPLLLDGSALPACRSLPREKFLRKSALLVSRVSRGSRQRLLGALGFFGWGAAVQVTPSIVLRRALAADGSASSSPSQSRLQVPLHQDALTGRRHFVWPRHLASLPRGVECANRDRWFCCLPKIYVLRLTYRRKERLSIDPCSHNQRWWDLKRGDRPWPK